MRGTTSMTDEPRWGAHTCSLVNQRIEELAQASGGSGFGA